MLLTLALHLHNGHPHWGPCIPPLGGLILGGCPENFGGMNTPYGGLNNSLKRASCVVCWLWNKPGFSLADVQSDVILPSCLHVTAISIDQLLCRRRFVIMLVHVSVRRCCKSLAIADRCLYSVYTHVPASVHKFCSQLDCLADTDLDR